MQPVIPRARRKKHQSGIGLVGLAVLAIVLIVVLATIAASVGHQIALAEQAIDQAVP